MDRVLVVVDMQIKFLKEVGAENIVAKVVEKIKRRTADGYDVVLTEDRCGGEIQSAVAQVCTGRKIYRKHSYGCEELILDLKRRNPDTVEFIGVCTDICVITNVLATVAFLPFSEILVDSACCASEERGHLAALRVMKNCNVNIN